MYISHKTTNPYLDKVRSHKEPYTTIVSGNEILVYPGVMSPKYDWSSHFIVDNLPNVNNKKVLEVGSGCGVLSLFSAINGANTVISLDINKIAVENTNANFKAYSLDTSSYKAIYSDMFSNLTKEDKFNTVIFNAPFHGNKPNDDLEKGVSDYNYETLKKFFENVSKHLADEGEIHLAFSDSGDLSLLKLLIIQNKFLVQKVITDTREGWTCYLFTLTKITFKNVYQQYIYEDDLFWFLKYKQYIQTGNILKIGAGLGYTTYFISLFNENITTLDVVKNTDAIKSELVTVYNGIDFPYTDNHFDIVICAYTLHHIKEQDRVFSEIHRVLKNKMILIEELYTGLFSYIKLVINCWSFNKKAGQSVTIYLNRYYSEKRFLQSLEKYKFKIVERIKKDKNSIAELFLLDK